MQQLQEASNAVSVTAVLINSLIADMLAHEDDIFYKLHTVHKITPLVEAFSKALDDMMVALNDYTEGLANEVRDITGLYM